MLVDGLTLTDSSDISNLVVASGIILPPGSAGELFYRTDLDALYVFNGSSWNPVYSGALGFGDLNIKQACVVGTTANITLGGFQTIDGYAIVTGDRVLVKNQSLAKENGIYIATGGVWTRANDFNITPPVQPGDFIFVTRGTAQADTGWVLTTDGVIQIGSTALTFAQFTGANAVPGGTNNSIQFNNAGAFAGTDGLAWANASATLTIGRAGMNSVIAGLSGAAAGMHLALSGGTSAGGQGGDIGISAGTGTADLGGRVFIYGGPAVSGVGNGNIFIQSGTGGSTAAYISLQTGISATERLRILGTGAWSVGTGGAAYGTSGQVLTSNGNAAPTWTTIATGFSGGTVTGAATFTSAVPQITLGVAGSTSGLIVSASGRDLNLSSGGSASGAGNMSIQPGQAMAGLGGIVMIYGGTGSSGGGAVALQGGTSNGGTAGGNVTIVGGASGSSGTGGAVVFSTYNPSTVIERLRILANGAWSVGSTGTATGTSGQVLTSNGNAAPTWSTVAAGAAAAGTLTGTTLASNVVTSSLTSVGTLGVLTVSSDALVHGIVIGAGGGSVLSNTAVGANALQANTTASNNTATGANALQANTTAGNNTAVGANALQVNTIGSNNTAVGRTALQWNTGSNNTATGSQALQSNTSGTSNSAMGVTALFSNTTGNYNVAIGTSAGWGITGTHGNTTGSSNTFIGYGTYGAGAADTNEIVIGANAIGLGSNTTVIGNSSTASAKIFGAATFTSTVATGGYTVATLPAGSTGMRAYVTDALTPSFLAVIAGGGSVVTPVFYNGSAWVAG